MRPRWNPARRFLRFAASSIALFSCLDCAGPLLAADLVPIGPLGLRVARGFRVRLWADADLANDIYAMTLDARGNVVVTGSGYIKTLFDANGDGVADSATMFAPLSSGGMGLCFDGPDLYCAGDGALLRFTDRDGDGVADGPPENLLPLTWAEHGGHVMRKGPDGWWYLIAGNETKFSVEHNTLPTAPVRNIEAGALLRLTPDARNCEVIAHGFRNPYDFDFNWLGDLFTCDSDVESDFFLPWYMPTRLYHVACGGHHGWRLEGWRRSWPRPDYYADTVDVLAPIGRGSPTGVVCYRHNQFPPYFRNGLFFLDWTFGRVYFTPLAHNGSSYQANPDVFLEPIGTHGFAPTDIVVTPDGSLLVSIGGRKTRGAIYRIDSIAAGPPALYASNWINTATSEAEAVLNAPQPLDAWSRAYWVPVAQRLGPAPFSVVVGDNRYLPTLRVRAIEVLTEVHGGLDPATALVGAQASSPFVRARVAWSLGRVPSENFAAILLGLSRDNAPNVRICALDALAAHAADVDLATLQQALGVSMLHADKRVRLAAARLATVLPEQAWQALWMRRSSGDLQARLTATLALLWRSPQNSVNVPAVESALSVLAQSRLADYRLQAVRLIILALGDWRLHDPSVEVYTAYEPANSLQGQTALVTKTRNAVRPILPSGDANLDEEAARLLAMVEDDSPETPSKIISFLTDKTTATSDFHYLAVLSRLKGSVPTNSAARIAHTILSLDRKLEGQEKRTKQNWTVRLTEVVQNLLRRDPLLADALLRDPDFALPAHITLAASLEGARYLRAARLYLAAIKKNPRFAWSGPLIDLLSSLPAEEVHPLLRQQWSNVALRDDLLLKLAEKPEAVDRDKFIAGLASLQSQVVRASVAALLELPREQPSKALLPALRLLRRLLSEPKEQAARAQLIALLNRETGQSFNVQELGNGSDQLKRAYQPIFDWVAQKFPTVISALDKEGADDPAMWEKKLKAVAWDRGDAARGEVIFNERGCQTCHAASTPLGPDLRGVTGRLSPVDLFNAIVFPSRDVAPLYRTTTFQTRDGQTYNGIVIFESADGVIVQAGATTTVRLADSDIVSRQPSAQSLMPGGLLAGLKPQELTDLHAYLKTLQSSGR